MLVPAERSPPRAAREYPRLEGRRRGFRKARRDPVPKGTVPNQPRVQRSATLGNRRQSRPQSPKRGGPNRWIPNRNGRVGDAPVKPSHRPKGLFPTERAPRFGSSQTRLAVAFQLHSRFVVAIGGNLEVVAVGITEIDRISTAMIGYSLLRCARPSWPTSPSPASLATNCTNDLGPTRKATE